MLANDIRRIWIEKLVQNKSFAEVGGLWGGGHVLTYGLGAKSLCMVDVMEGTSDWWEKFREVCKRKAINNVREVVASIDDNRILELMNRHDVVYTSGVLYHCPNPIMTIRNLLSVTNEWLILGSVVFPSVITNSKGALKMSDENAYFVPGLSETNRAIFARYVNDKIGFGAGGLDTPPITDWHLPNGEPNYSPWWWLWTKGFVRHMLSTFPIDIVQEALFPEGRNICALFMCRKRT
jgi:hypothetical protein